jgi:hypothetical protein
MAKFSILGSFDAEAIPNIVPPDFRVLVRMATRAGGEYLVLLFAPNRSHGGVVTSAAARRALRRVPADARLLAIGTDFTLEATQLLNERDAAIARIGEFG